jgi:cytochrome c553
MVSSQEPRGEFMARPSSEPRFALGKLRLVLCALLAPALLVNPLTPSAAASRVPELTARALASKPNAQHGEFVYRTACAGCHQKNAWGAGKTAVPALAGQHPSYLVKQLAAFIEFEREDSASHGLFADADLSRPQTLADLAAYLGSLPANPQPQTGGAQALDRGERWYMDHCSTCHLAKGQGQAQSFVPALGGQNYSYLLVQLRRLAHGHRPDIPDELLEVFDAMTSADMEAVADYLSRLSPDPSGTTARLDSGGSL